MSLEAYLEGPYYQDRQDIESIEALLADVARTFKDTYVPANNSWPYNLKASETLGQGTGSHGTSAMILAAIGKIIGKCKCRDGKFAERFAGLSKTDGEKLGQIFEECSLWLAKEIRPPKKIKSGTFGESNPLTISHLTDLAWCSQGSPIAAPVKKSVDRKTIRNFVKLTLSRGKSIQTELAEKNSDGKRKILKWSERSAFIALKVYRLTRDVEELSGGSVSKFKKERERFKDFFEEILHEQLSFSSIPDSRFDPAELAFSLEGMMLCAPQSVDPVLFGRVFTVLSEKQETSAYWRPNRPFIAKQTGEIMLPLSVEGANALLRAVELMDKNRIYETFAAKAIPMFRRFWQWLRARLVELELKSSRRTTCKGWISEHINNTGIIDLWDTSQIVEFLIAFRRLLQKHIARETLILSRVKVEEPKQDDSWSNIIAKYEPLQGNSVQEPKIFRAIEEDFIKPRQRGDTSNRSMLLFGPPGTGKTTVAKSLANALKYRLLTVTVSDFLGQGGAMVEARAKAIFQMLEAQSDTIILFDEIDAFLLDRNSQLYRKQDTLFQFLTPGMLTKISDLHEVNRSIFIIATNYENRIDPAIKRAGRIDQSYLLMPPDKQKRKQTLADLLQKLDIKQPLDLDLLANKALYLSYKEMEGVFLRLLPEEKDQGGMQKKLERVEKSSSYKQYLERLRGERFPYKEFRAVVRLANEANGVSDINTSLGQLKRKSREAWDRLMETSPDLRKDLQGLGITELEPSEAKQPLGGGAK